MGTKQQWTICRCTSPPGEIYGFIGHNGAGKTTTLKVCCRYPAVSTPVRSPSTAHSIQTRALWNASESLAYIPDNPDLYDYMTGIQYLNFIAERFRRQRRRTGRSASASYAERV